MTSSCPPLDTAVADGTKIAVQYGRQVTVKVDGQQKSFWTTATTVDQALQSLQLDTSGADLSTSRSAGIGREGLNLTVNTAKTVTIESGGKDKKLETTALTVGEALTEAGIAVDSNDKLSAKESTKLKDGLEFAVTKVDVKTVTKTKKVGYDTVYKNTDDLDKGKTKVDTDGKKGERTIVYREVRHDGKLVKRTEKSSKITPSPGTRSCWSAPRRTRSQQSSGGRPAATPSGIGWRSASPGGNWSINTGNGFYGGLQFTASTWRAMGGSGLPHQASRETQIAVAKKLQARAGWGQWPGCTSKLGLR